MITRIRNMEVILYSMYLINEESRNAMQNINKNDFQLIVMHD